MSLQSVNFQQLLEPKFRKLFFEAYSEIPEQYSKIFSVKKSKKAKEYDYHVSGTGKWEEKQPSGPIAEDTIEHGQEVTYIHKSYAKMISVERELADDDQYNVIEKLPKALGRGCRVTVEETAISVINNGFTTNGYDGVPLFDDEHPLLRGGTASNLLTGAALSDSSLKLAIAAMKTQTLTQEGFKMQANAKQLIVHPDNEFNALTILNSTLQAGTANNDKNVIKNRLSCVVMDYLDDPDAWFLRDPRLSETNFFWRVKPEFKATEVFDNMVAKYRGYARFSVGYSDWRGWMGNPGA
jgi:phage major head subunit gpT-like protein